MALQWLLKNCLCLYLCKVIPRVAGHQMTDKNLPPKREGGGDVKVFLIKHRLGALSCSYVWNEFMLENIMLTNVKRKLSDIKKNVNKEKVLQQNVWW